MDTTERWQARGAMNSTEMLIVRAGLKDESPDWALTTAMNEHGPDFFAKVSTSKTGVGVILSGESDGHKRAYLMAAAPDLRAALAPLAMAARAQYDAILIRARVQEGGAKRESIEAAERWLLLHNAADAAITKADQG